MNSLSESARSAASEAKIVKELIPKDQMEAVLVYMVLQIKGKAFAGIGRVVLRAIEIA